VKTKGEGPSIATQVFNETPPHPTLNICRCPHCNHFFFKTPSEIFPFYKTKKGRGAICCKHSLFFLFFKKKLNAGPGNQFDKAAKHSIAPQHRLP
jgi:hypothetical protein